MNIDRIIRRSLKGSRRAQRKLYEAYSDKLMGVCIRYMANEYEANDVFQDTWISIFDKLHQFDTTRGEFGAWAYRITVNKALLALRTKNKFVDDDIEEFQFTDKAVTVDDNMSFEELNKIVDKLPEKQRLVFNLYVVEGYTHAEIGNMMGINEGTSKSQLARARANLQKMINYTK